MADERTSASTNFVPIKVYIYIQIETTANKMQQL